MNDYGVPEGTVITYAATGRTIEWPTPKRDPRLDWTKEALIAEADMWAECYAGECLANVDLVAEIKSLKRAARRRGRAK